MASSLPSPPSSRPSTSPPAKSQFESLPKDPEDGGHQPVPAHTKIETADNEPEEDNNDETDLSHRLDSLLESYLAFLDQYTRLREQLSKEFSSGFFALAQANRTSTLGPGRRYGEEGYDKRMKASKKVDIDLDTFLPTLLDENTTTVSEDKTGAGAAGILETDREPKTQLPSGAAIISETSREGKTRLPSPQDDPVPVPYSLPTEKDNTEPNQVTTPTSQFPKKENHQSTNPNNDQDHTAPSNTSTLNVSETLPVKLLSSLSLSCRSYTIKTVPSTNTDTNTSSGIKDPLKWYGILVPPTLRHCQSHFSSSVASTIPRLLSTISALKTLDSEIRRVRRELGLLDLYDLDPEYRDHDTDSVNNTDREPRLDDNDGTATAGTSSFLSSAPLVSSGKSGNHTASGSRAKLASSIETSSSSTTSKRQTLFSSSPQPSEPRSRLLKLD
ncbi:hypothetical protein HRR83_006693 [Exophiala dermatitidis]|uniref:Vacuolar ATPase assembly protein VMA22 n=2 Tax=Exophiala dermatitidis TaxID=5970 RepID=H6BVQ3_EXODN|nr:uncharacterized protein HMPREF1120_04038 [Exophiala dermatitidis NIH/UT8656]KAJ4511436.1 hypothetical protein HRR75_005362 [Exophiala dermatitidis]EHY55929.1 hypothetical protein HMPREF1120_04038 [Exophiala dermatitidis NIH/UT8656]KAJ4514194.1 hypothetical protein HRR74_005853 [Exophiala dermatitidis]KAJ4515322.1 hypothetical protein HRR73_005153 [Exophiala dermatitidis]KAJ4533843.1 hypothetical protein HRR77_008327 [Exophiala dermatitidis]